MPKIKVNSEDEIIDINFAHIGLQDFFTTNSSRSIRFFGSGEPTLAFNRLVEIWNIAHQMAGSNLHAELESNGYFGERIAKWVENHINSLWISCDGPKEIQNIQRPTIDGQPSSEIVLKNVKRFARSQKLQFGVRATIDFKNLDKQVDLIEYFHSLGVKYVSASPTYHSIVNYHIKTPPLIKFAHHFVPAYYRAIDLGMFYQTLLIVNFDEQVDIYCQSSIPTPRLTTDGYVSCCDWTSMGPKYLPSKVQQELIYGYFDKYKGKIVYDQTKINRIRKRNIYFLEKNACKGCKALHHCAGGCVGKMMAETKSLYKATPEWCVAVRYLFNKLPINKGLYPFLHP